MKRGVPKRSKSMQKQESWGQPHHILLLIIILQGGFMVYMALQGPAHHESEVPSPHNNKKHRRHHHRPVTTKEWKAGAISRSASQDQMDNLRLRIDEASKQRQLDLESIQKKKQEALEQARGRRKNSINPKSTIPPQYESMIQKKEWEVNSMEFPGALHYHFVQEQKQPFFRNPNNENKKSAQDLMIKYQDAEKEARHRMIRKKVKLHACYFYSDNDEPPQLRLNRTCFRTGRKGYNGVLVYNPLPFNRTWCGKTIKANGVKHYSRLCPNSHVEPSRILLPESDKIVGTSRRDLRKMIPAPIVFERENSYGSIEAVKDCDVPCKFTMDTCTDDNDKDLKGEACLPEVSDFVVQGTDWKFRYSMLDPRLAPQSIGISRKGYRENQFYATRSFQSEIPLSTFDWDKHGEMYQTPANDFKKAGKNGICFLHGINGSPCMGEIRPGVYVSKIQENFKGNFDYYGPCNFGPKMKPKKSTRFDLNKYEDRQTIMSQYMFTLIIGHSQAPDMVTDLIWDALTAGSIPVYHGAPNVRDHVPKNSIIVGGEHSTQQALAEYLNEIMGSRKLWKELHSWRDDADDAATTTTTTRTTSSNLIQDKYGFLKSRSSTSFCRMCRWAMATKYSLGWDPVKQIIKNPATDRNFCVSPKDEVRSPVDELWMSDLSMQRIYGRQVCNKESAEQTFVYDDLSIARTVVSHDNGVIDFAITDIKSERQNLKIVLRLLIKGVKNVNGAHIIEPHQILMDESSESSTVSSLSDHIPIMSSIAIQDDKTRATIITNWVTSLTTPKTEGFVDILIKDLTKPVTGKPREPRKDEADDAKQPRLMEDEVLKIRIIIEDVNLLRDAWTEYNLSPYARLMMIDFLDPLMYFSVSPLHG